MAVEDQTSGVLSEGPFTQFEQCTYDIECRFKDTQGLCIFEACIMQHTLPPQTILWYFECIYCKKIDCIKPSSMKIHLCATCIQRIQAVEALPVKCRWCGASINTPPSWMFSGLCETCLGKIKAAAFCAHCGRA